MKYIVTCREMKMLDSHTIQKKGIPSLVLMERAALKNSRRNRSSFQRASRTTEDSVCLRKWE